ncbi:hypothetical protein [Hymenobacter baengnokdamensis]|uniref:hypothetical protein n=1 Tax=Hymenobacter baengnokdamensis TaxID=2615203 RepID=UPI001243FAFB|nr:hypothetical protein [Hymenobacter baengnokdamensis]
MKFHYAIISISCFAGAQLSGGVGSPPPARYPADSQAAGLCPAGEAHAREWSDCPKTDLAVECRWNGPGGQALQTRYPGATVRVTLTPLAPLPAGTQGQAITRQVPIGTKLFIKAIPLGLYSCTGTIAEGAAPHSFGRHLR